MKSIYIKKHHKLGAGFLITFLPLYPILSIYSHKLFGFNLLDVGLITFLLYTVIFFFTHRLAISLNKRLVTFIAYSIMLNLFLLLSAQIHTTTAIAQLIRYCSVSLILGVFSEKINIDRLYKWLKVVGIIIMVGLFFQSYKVYILNQPISPIIILPVTNYENWATNIYRPTSFFQEPSSYAVYCSLLLLLNLKYKDYFYAIILIISIALSTSTLGIALVLVICFSHILINKSIKISIRIILILIFAALGIAYFTLPIFDVSSSKVMNVGNTFSDYLRMYKALETFVQLPIFYKIFGIGNGNVATFASSHNLNLSWLTSVHAQYETTGFGVFVEYGLIGGVLFYSFFTTYIKRAKGNYWAWTMIIMIILMIFTSTFFFNTYFLYYLLILEGILRQEKVADINIENNIEEAR